MVARHSRHVAAVIGAGPGLGRALAWRLGGRQAPPAADCPRRTPADCVSDELRATGATVTIKTADAADAAEIYLALQPPHEHGRLGVVAYNAVYAAGTLSSVDLPAMRDSPRK